MGRTRTIFRLPHVLPLAALLLLVGGCDTTSLFDSLDNGDDADVSDNTPVAAETDIVGLNVAVADSDVDTVFNRLADRIANQTGLIDQVDHQANAQGANRNLRPTRLIIFDNPANTTPLIQADPRAGLDLPPKMLVYQDGDGDTAVAFNDPDYLAARYALGDAGDALDAMDDNLRTLAIDAADGNAITREGANAGVTDGDGIVTVDSDNGFNATVNTLATAINTNADLALVAQVDQQARAAQVGLGINPSVLLIFGNPNAGTPLLQSSQTVGIDLPQKMLVAQADDGTVRIYYNSPQYLAERHDIDGQSDRLDAIADLLSDLADQASTAGTTGGSTGTFGGNPGRGGTSNNPGNTGSSANPGGF